MRLTITACPYFSLLTPIHGLTIGIGDSVPGEFRFTIRGIPGAGDLRGHGARRGVGDLHGAGDPLGHGARHGAGARHGVGDPHGAGDPAGAITIRLWQTGVLTAIVPWEAIPDGRTIPDPDMETPIVILSEAAVAPARQFPVPATMYVPATAVL